MSHVCQSILLEKLLRLFDYHGRTFNTSQYYAVRPLHIRMTMGVLSRRIVNGIPSFSYFVALSRLSMAPFTHVSLKIHSSFPKFSTLNTNERHHCP